MQSKKVNVIRDSDNEPDKPKWPSYPASAGTGSTGREAVLTLTGSGAAGSFFFGTFFLAEKKKVHPQALIKPTIKPNEELP